MVPVYWHPLNHFHYRKNITPSGRVLVVQTDSIEKHIPHSKSVRKYLSVIYSQAYLG